MTSTIEQTVEFRGVTPERLFDLYVDAKQHAAAIGGPVEMDARVGGRFAAFGGLAGRNLLIEPPRTIVQAWRANVWRREDPDSVLILTFAPTRDGARVALVHVNVPEHARQIIHDGWHQHYWSRWAGFLAEER